MRSSRLSWYKQVRLIEYFVGGSTARCASRLVGVSRSTAIFYYHRLRELIVTHLERETDDVCDANLKHKHIDADIIFHVATVNDIISRNFEDGINISLLGTKNLLDFALASNISKIVFFSTL